MKNELKKKMEEGIIEHFQNAGNTTISERCWDFKYTRAQERSNEPERTDYISEIKIGRSIPANAFQAIWRASLVESFSITL